MRSGAGSARSRSADAPDGAPRLAVVLCAAAVAIAAANLAGWATADPLLIRGHPQWPPLPPWGSILIATLAVAVLLQIGRPGRARIRLARVLAGLAGVAIASLLVDRFTTMALELDRWWFATQIDATGLPSSGRLTVQSSVALSVLIIGALVVWADDRQWQRIRIWLFGIGLVLPCVVVLQYLLLGHPLTPPGSGQGVPLGAAIAFLLLLFAEMLARPDQPPVSRYWNAPYRRSLTRLVGVVVALPFVLAFVVHLMLAAGASDDSAWVFAVVTGLLTIGGILTVMARRESAIDQERSAALDRALAAEHRYRLLAEHSSDAVFEMTATTSRYTWFSPSIEALLGWTPDDLLGRTPLDVVDPLDAPRLRLVIAEVGAGNTRHFRARYRTKAGGSRWLDVTVRPIFDEDGTLVGRVGSYRDAQATVHLEHELAAGEERFRTALANAPAGMALVAPDGRLLTVNASFCQMLDRTEAAMLASTWQELTHPDDVAADQSRVDEMLAGTLDSYRMVKRYLRPDGAIVWGDLGVGCVRDEAGRVVTFISQITDVTREHAATELLAASEERYRLLAENMTDVVCHLRDGRIVWISPSAADVWGAPPEHWLGATYTDLVHPDARAELTELIVQAQAGTHATRRGRFRAADGSYHWMEAHVGPFVDQDGAVDGAIASVRNVDREVAFLDELSALARFDTLTGLLNRRAALDRLHTETEQRRPGGALAILFCDVDRFKSINDRYGHAAGDAVLRTIANRIAAVVRLDDVVARIGGDELLVLLTGAHNLEEARSVAEKIRAAVAEPIEVDGVPLLVTLSVGVTLHDQGEPVDVLLARADTAMYEAKQAGRDRVVVLA